MKSNKKRINKTCPEVSNELLIKRRRMQFSNRLSKDTKFKANCHMARYDCSDEYCINDKFLKRMKLTYSDKLQRYNPIKRASTINCNGISKRSALHFKVIENIQDVFLHVLRYFVADSGLVDGQSIRSIMLVCKSWNKIATSTILWETAARDTYVSCDDCHLQSSEGENSNYSNPFETNVIGRNVTELPTSRKICAIIQVPVHKMRKQIKYNGSSKKIVISNKVQDKLIAFAKLGVHSIGSEGICFKIKERATGKLMALKTPWNFDFDRRNYHCNDGKSQPSTTLREIATLQRIKGPNYFSPSGQIKRNNITSDDEDGGDGRDENKASRHICLPRAISMINGHLLRWYDFVEYSMGDFLEERGFDHKNERIKKPLLPPNIVQNWLRQILTGIENLHRRGVIHRNLKPKHLLMKNLSSDDMTSKNSCYNLSQVVIQISDFTMVRVNSFPIRPLSPKVVSLWYRSPEILLQKQNYTTAVDIWSVGCIFAEILRGQALFRGRSEMDQMTKLLESVGNPKFVNNEKFSDCSHSNKEWLRLNVPDLCNEGLDLLSKLLEMNPDKRITVSDALRHPYLCMNQKNFVCNEKEEIDTTVTNNQNYTIAKALMELEMTHTKLSKSSNLLQSNQEELTNNVDEKFIKIDQWAKLVDWMIEIVDVFEKHPRTAFLAMDYFHKFVSSVKVSHRHFQLVAVTCLHIASKCEDVDYIGLTDLVFSADNTFSGDDVILMERKILSQINWRLSDPLPYDFISLYLDFMHETFAAMNFSSEKVFWMVQYVSELTLQCNISLTMYNPSILAACVISLSLECLRNGTNAVARQTSNESSDIHGEAIWPKTLEEISHYNLTTHQALVQSCKNALLVNITHIKTFFPELKIISRRFRKSARGQVFELSIPNIHR